MIAFFLACLSFSAFKAPKWSMIWSDKHFDDSELSEIKAGTKILINEVKKQCSKLEGDEKDKCIAVLDGFVSIYPNNVEDINSEIPKITNDVDLLYIVSGDIENPADFSKLKKQMMVLFLSKKELDSKILSKHDMIMEHIIAIKDNLIKNDLKLTEQTMIQLSKSLTTNKRPKSPDYVINIKGNINNKISFLTAVKYNFIVHDQDLIVHSIYLDECSIDDSGFKIISEFLLADIYTHQKLFGYTYETPSELYSMFETKQYSLVNKFDSDYKIRYSLDGLTAEFLDRYSNEYRGFFTPNDFCEVFSVISQVKAAYMFYEDEMVGASELKTLNLTFIDNPLSTSIPFSFQANEKESIEIDFMDEWEIPIKLYLTFDKSKYKVKMNMVNDYIDASEENLYEYRSGSDQNNGNNKTGMIAGIVVAVVVVIAIVVVVVIIVLKKKKNAAKENSADENEI